MKIEINEKQRLFILRAINNIDTLYDFSISDKEFKDFGITKEKLMEEVNKLKEVLK